MVDRTPPSDYIRQAGPAGEGGRPAAGRKDYEVIGEVEPEKVADLASRVGVSKEQLAQYLSKTGHGTRVVENALQQMSPADVAKYVLTNEMLD